MEDHKEAFNEGEVAFCCLGTTRGKSGADGFVKVDYDYVVNSAKLLKENGVCKDYHLVSSKLGCHQPQERLLPQAQNSVIVSLVRVNDLSMFSDRLGQGRGKKRIAESTVNLSQTAPAIFLCVSDFHKL